MEQLQKMLTSTWNEWTVEELLGEGTFGKVYKIRREFLGREQFAALKVISISQNRTNSGFSFSMDDKSFVDEIISEIELMAKFKGNSNVVSYEDHKVIKENDGLGWTILIRMELLTPLSSYIKTNDVTEETVINLGKDISKALVMLNKHNIIHRDIKLENIFVSENGDFKLGDFGTARIIEKTVDNRTKTGTYMYMAPEVIRSEPYGAKADIYSLGILMYYLLNHQRFPFFPKYPEQVKFEDHKTAFSKRISGEAIAPPDCDNKKLSTIVLKACEFDSKNRYTDAQEMNSLLESLSSKKTNAETLECIGKNGGESVNEDLAVKNPHKIINLRRFVILFAVLFVGVTSVFLAIKYNNDSENNQTSVTVVENTNGTLKYKAYDDGISILGMTEECETLVIPAEIDGKPVVAIDSGAFANCLFTAIQLPDTLESIGNNAFINCKSLGSISIPEGVKLIGERAFEKCFSLVSVELPQSLETIGSMAFKDCIRLFTITVPEGLKNAGLDIFAYTPYIKNRENMLSDFKNCLDQHHESKYVLLDVDNNGVEELIIFGQTEGRDNNHKYRIAAFDYKYGETEVEPEDYNTFHIEVPTITLQRYAMFIYNNYEKLYYSDEDKCLYGCTYDNGFEAIYKISLEDGSFKESLYREESFVGDNPTVLGEEIVFEYDAKDVSHLENTVMRGIVKTEE